ncbi:hypothetical protein JCM8547_001319 [Rhodosporidiobolus lusitaniae]
MSTSLAQQLAQRQTLDSARLHSVKSLKNPPSFIYNPKHAAAVSSADLHALADNAWDQLAQVDPFFALHHKDVLGEQAKTLDRSALTKEENDKVGRMVDKVLRALGKHMLLKPAGIVLEWLVRRFRVQELNVPGLIGLFLPYHTTPHFASGLNLIPESTLTNSIFVSLFPAKKSLAPIALPDLIDLLPPFSSSTSARPVLDFILRLPLDFLASEQVPHRALTAFWLQLLAGYLDRAGSRLPDGERAAVLSTVLEVLRSARSAPDTLLASYILVARFAMHSPFDEETLRVVLKGVVSNRARSHVADEETDAALVTTLIVISQLGEDEVVVAPGKKFLGNSGWKSLLRTSKLDELVVTLSNQYDAQRFMRPFLQTLAEEARTSEECLKLLGSLLRPLPTPSSSIPLTLPTPLISHLLSCAFTTISHSESDSPTSPTALLKPLSQIYQRYPAIWTAESKAVTTRLAADQNALQRVLQAMNAVLLGGDASASSTASDALVLGAAAPDVALRVAALKEVLASSTTLVEAGNEGFLRDTLVARLAEPEPSVAEVLFSDKENREKLLSVLSAEEILDAVTPALQTGANKAEYLNLVLPFLSGPLVAANPSAASNVLKRVFWPRLLGTTFGGKTVVASTLSGWSALRGSELEKTHAWISGLGGVLPSEEDGVSVETNGKIVDLVAANLAAFSSEANELDEAEAFLLAQLEKKKDDVLAALVALRYASKAPSSRRVRFALSVSTALRVEQTGLDALVGDGKAEELVTDSTNEPAGGLQQAVFAKPGAAATGQKVRASVLVGVVRAVEASREAAWSWLAPSPLQEKGKEGEEQYCRLCTLAYRLAHLHSGSSPAATSLSTQLLEALFSKLVTEDAVAFLAALFTTSSTVSLDLRLAALKDTAVFVEVLSAVTAAPKGKLVDWQVVVPSLVVALADEEKKVRVEALRVLEQVRKSMQGVVTEGKKVGSVYGREAFYGKEASGNVKYLEAADVVAYLDKLLASSTELTLSPTHLATLHSSLLDASSSSASPAKDSKKRKNLPLSVKVATYLVSHVQAWGASLPARVAVLTALEGVKDKDQAAAQVALLSEAVFAPSSSPSATVDLELATAYARLLLAPFDGASRKWLESPSEGSTSSSSSPIEVLVQAIEVPEITGLKAAVRKEALRVVAKSVFGAVKGETRGVLWSRLVRLAVEAEARVNTDVLACLRACPVDTDTLTSFLTSIRTSIAPPASKPSAKRGRASLSHSSSSLPSSTSRTERLPELVVVLESVEFASVPASHGLLLGLFELLATLVDLPSTNGGQNNDVSYPGQLILGALARVVKNVGLESGVTGESIRMAPVLNFMRSAINPQTYHQSLLLLAQLGPLVPDQLVHNVIPIFTFMGANVLQRDDAYSLRVVDQTLDNIVPALVKAMQKSASGREGLLSELKDLLRAFTDAAAHVPRHRRINLFVRLVETLGAKEFLSAVAMLLVEKAGKVDGEPLPLVLFEHFDVDVQLSALRQVVEEVERLVNLEVSFLAASPSESVTPTKAKEQSLSLLTFLSFALESKQLLSKVDNARTLGSETVDLDLSQLVRGLLDLTSATSPSFSESDKSTLSEAADYAVHSAVALMSTHSFAEALLWLLELADPAIQPRAFALLRTRLPRVSPTRRADLSAAVIAVVERALSVLGESDAEAVEVDGALSTLKAVADSVLPAEDAALAKTVLPLVEVAKDGERSKAARVTALEVIARLTTRLGPRLIPLVAKLVPFALELLREEAKAGAEAVIDLVTGAYSTLEGLFASVPTFIGGQLDKVFSASLSPDVMALSEVKGSRPSKARAGLLSTAAKKLPAKTLYPAIVRLHASLDGTQREPLLGLLEVLTRALRYGSAADVVENYRSIFKLFLTVFDLRRVHSDQLDLEDVTVVEDNALGAFVQFILKLNEQIFRPLFLRTYDWAVIDLSETEAPADEVKAGLTARRTVLYKVVDRLVGQLKSIFVPYWSFMLDQTVELLDGFAKGEQTDADLWNAIAVSLTKALDADETGFWTPSRLAKLSSPIAHQIEVSPYIAQQPIYHSLLSSFSDLVSSHESHLKTLNSTFLHFTRSDDLRVKRGAIEALEQMWESVGDGMLGLVPETTPFLAEAREETEGGVEAATRRLIRKIEEYLGEELETYLS